MSRWAEGLLVAALAASLAGSAAGASTAATPPDTSPVTVSPAGLRALSHRFGMTIFWVGPKQGMRYEVRRSGGNVYVRYLPPGVPTGAPENDFLTVVTYRFAGAYKKLETLASYRGIPIPGTGLAYVDTSDPGSIHVAYRQLAGYQAEVYDTAPRRALRVALSGVLQPVTGALAGDDPGGVVSRWIALAYDETAIHSLDAPRLWRAMGLVSVAVENAALGVSPPHADAASAGAAQSLLAYFFPAERDVFAAAAAPETRDRQAFAFGRAVAVRAIARARSDGSEKRWDGHLPAAANAWVPTPPDRLPPIEPLAGRWRTWLLKSGGSVQPPPPPAPGSKTYRRDVREVYDVSHHLTTAEINLALWWAADPRWPRMAVSAVTAARLSPQAAARFYGTFFATEADAIIACWAAKYRYWTARPVTVIRRELDATWSPLVDTPAFPSYVSAHSVLSAAATVVLDRYFPGKKRYFDRQAEQASMSRLYGGIHYRSDITAGLTLGRRIGEIDLGRQAVLEKLLRRPAR